MDVTFAVLIKGKDARRKQFVQASLMPMPELVSIRGKEVSFLHSPHVLKKF